jgi:uncharacterized alpha/beta hydrolase family protein
MIIIIIITIIIAIITITIIIIIKGGVNKEESNDKNDDANDDKNNEDMKYNGNNSCDDETLSNEIAVQKGVSTFLCHYLETLSGTYIRIRFFD